MFSGALHGYYSGVKEKGVVVYSCSGCSNVAQLANNVAVKLHRKGIAQMSCIAGVGGDVKPLVNTAKNAQKVLALDGCPLECARQCLRRHGVEPDEHVVLTKNGLTKNPNEDVSEETFNEFYEKVVGIVGALNDKEP